MGDLIWKFSKILWGQNFFLHLWGVNRYGGELKLHGGEYYLLLYLHYFISSETANTQKSEAFFKKISFGNVNASGVVTCPHIY